MLSIALPIVDSWNVWYSHYGNSVAGFRQLRSRVDELAAAAGREPGAVDATAAVLVRLPGGKGRVMGDYGDDGPQPVSGSAAQIAEHLDALADAGATHLQLVVDPITTATIERARRRARRARPRRRVSAPGGRRRPVASVTKDPSVGASARGHTGGMSDGTAEHGGHAHGHGHGHSHDDVDWAAQAALLSASDDLEVGRNQAIVDWLGVGDGDVAVEVGSGAGGMAAALLGAVGTAGTVIIVDGAAELLALAQRRARRPGHHLVALHADIDAQPLGTVLQHRRPVDLVYASAVVHHLDDELAAVREFASVVRPGGRVAVAEGGLEPSLPARRLRHRRARPGTTVGGRPRGVVLERGPPSGGDGAPGLGDGTCCSPTPGWSTSPRGRSCSTCRLRSMRRHGKVFEPSSNAS